MSETAPSGYSILTINSQEALRLTELQHQEAERQAIFQRAIDNRSNSYEVNLLNNEAELQIFGSRGSDTPGGILDNIKHNPRYGTKEADRFRAADNYKQDIESLLGQGLELCQAKLVMDLSFDLADVRDQRKKTLEKKKSMYMNLGLSEAEASKKASSHKDVLKYEEQLQVYEAKDLYQIERDEKSASFKQLYKEGLTKKGYDEARSEELAEIEAKKRVADIDQKIEKSKSLEQIIKDNGIFTREEFDRFVKGEKLYDELGSYISASEPKKDVTDDDPDKKLPELPSPDNSTGELPEHGIGEPELEKNSDLTREEKIRNAQLYGLDKDDKEAIAMAMEEAIEINESEYAQLSALRRRSAFIAAKNLKGKRAATRLAPEMRATDERVEASRKRLEAIRIRNHNAMKQRLLDAGATPKEINEILAKHDAMFAQSITAQTAIMGRRFSGLPEHPDELKINYLKGVRKFFHRFSREGLSDQRVQFYEWWGRQGGGGERYFSRGRILGTLKKMAVFGSIGLPAGVLGAMVAPGLGAGLGVAGIAYAGTKAIRIMQAIAGVHVEKNSEATVALEQAKREYQETLEEISRYYSSEKLIDVKGSVTGIHAEGTDRQVTRNKKRIVYGIGLTAVSTGAAAAFSVLGHTLANAHNVASVKPKSTLTPSSTTLPKTPSSTTLPKRPITTPRPHTPIAHRAKLINQPFSVSNGEGIINEINHYALERNMHLSPARALDIYKQLASRFGGHIIDLQGKGPSEYLISPGNWGITRSGSKVAKWGVRVLPVLNRLVSSSR